jgi:ketosteroid isomerase-like protein
VSAENVEVVRSLFQAFRARDTEAQLAMWHPDVRLQAADGAWHDGREGVRELFGSFLGTWDDYVLEVLDFIDAGDRVVVLLHERGRGKGSGVPVEWWAGQVYTVKDGLIVDFTVFTRHADALAEAGLPER